jgi:P-type Na+/K+ transporter
MVNSTDASAPPAPAISQHSGLISAQQASDDGCNDDPPPIPGPPADITGHSLPAGGVPRPNHDSHPGHLTAPPSSSGDQQQQQQQQDSRVVVRDYGAHAAPAAVIVPAADELHQTRSNEVSSDTAAASSLASPSPSPSSNSSTIAVGPIDDAAVAVDVLGLAAAAAAAPRYDGSNAHTVEVAVVAAALDVKLSLGLASGDARARLDRDGPNTLSADGGITWYGVLLRQVSNSLTLVRASPLLCS